MQIIELPLYGSGDRILVNLAKLDAVVECGNKTILFIDAKEFHVDADFAAVRAFIDEA